MLLLRKKKMGILMKAFKFHGDWCDKGDALTTNAVMQTR